MFRYRKRYAAPSERVWESLASDASISEWGPSIKEVTWLSPRPFGVGTTRDVALPGNLRVRERFIRRDEGSRYTFVVTDASMPALRRVAEDYAVEPDGDGALFRWMVAMESKGAHFHCPSRY